MKWFSISIILLISVGELSAQKALITVHSGDSTYLKNEVVQGFSANSLHGKFRTYDLTQVKNIRFYENVPLEVQAYFDSRMISYTVTRELEGEYGYFLSADSVYFDPDN